VETKIKHLDIILLVLFSAFLNGGIGAFSKIALRTIPPFSFVFLRFVIALIVLLPFVWGELKEIFSRKTWKLLAVSLFAVANFTLYIFGVARTTATISQTLYAATPLIVALLSFLLLKERFTKTKIFGLLIGFAGVLVIVLLPAFTKSSAFNGNLVGNLLIIGAVASWAIYTVLSKELHNHHSPLAINFVMAICAVVVQFVFAAYEYLKNPTWITNVSTQSLLGVLYIGVLATAVSYVLFQYAIEKASPVTATLTFYLMPVFSFLWAATLLGERLTFGLLIGGGLALTGVYVVTNSNNFSRKKA
jgi:drug/metabolite transporter (DMT)-like permease